MSIGRGEIIRKVLVKPEYRYYDGDVMGKMAGYMVTDTKRGFFIQESQWSVLEELESGVNVL